MEHTEPLVCPTHKSHYFFVLIVALILGGAGGVAYGYQKGFDTAKNLVEKSMLAPMIQTPQDIRSLSGSVTAVNGSTITIRTESSNPFEDQNLLVRTVIVSANTKIIKLSQKDPKVFQAEMDAFAKSPAVAIAGGVPAILPDINTHSVAAVSDLKIGERITVTATQNIKTMREFSADEIQIYSNPGIMTI